MNIYAKIITAFLLCEFAIQQTASYLSLQSVLRSPAEAFADFIDRGRFRELQHYAQARTRFSAVSDAFNLFVLFLFWFSGGFRWLNNWMQSRQLGPIWTGLFLLAALGLGYSLLSLPFSVYFTFVIEEQFGFNKTTVKTFIVDLVKGAGLAVVLAGPMAAAVLKLFTSAGTFGWVYAWLLVTAILLLLQVIAPRWIMPLFNKFEPLKDQQLLDAIASYTNSVEFPLKAVSVMDESTRSSKSNAFLTGFGRDHRLVLDDTLVARHTAPELVAVVAHEVGHFKQKHIPFRLVLIVLQMGVFFWVLSLFLRNNELYRAFYIERPSVALGIVFFVLLYSPVEFCWTVFQNWLARKQEYDADAFAARTTGQAQALIQTLRKITVDNLSQLAPHRMDVVLNYDHPTLEERIRVLGERELANPVIS